MKKTTPHAVVDASGSGNESKVHFPPAETLKLLDESPEELFHRFYCPLVTYVRGRFSKISMFAEEVAMDAVVDFLKYRAQNGNKDVWRALKRCARHRAISWIRKETAIIRGGVNLVSLEALCEVGFETGNSMYGSKSMLSDESQQSKRLHFVDQFEIIDRVIEVAKPQLSEREAILLGHIRRWAPVELSLDELSQELTSIHRQRFLPVRRDISLIEAEAYIVRQISRSKASLQAKLREVRASLG